MAATTAGNSWKLPPAIFYPSRINLKDCVAMVNAISFILIGVVATKIALTIIRKLCNIGKQDKDELVAASSFSKTSTGKEKRKKERKSKIRSEDPAKGRQLRGNKALMVAGEDSEAYLYSRNKMKKRLGWFGSPKLISVELKSKEDETTAKKQEKEEAVMKKEDKPIPINMKAPVEEKGKGSQVQSPEAVVSFSDTEVNSEGSGSLVMPAPSRSKDKRKAICTAKNTPVFEVSKRPVGNTEVKEKEEDSWEKPLRSSHSELFPEPNFPITSAFGQKRVGNKFVSISDDESPNEQINEGSHSRRKKAASLGSPMKKRFCGGSDSWEEIQTSQVQSDISYEPVFPQTSAWGQKRTGNVFIDISDESLPDDRKYSINSRPLKMKYGNDPSRDSSGGSSDIRKQP